MLCIVCGPTAAGKSALAMELAARHGLTIVSADSRQIYRGFDIGTAKPTVDERARVPHVGVDVADPMERWSAWRWASDAAAAIAALGDDRVLVVGGTGLYISALISPLGAQPELDPARREIVAREIGTWPVERLREWTRALDPARAHLGRTQLLRAIETVLLAGARVSDFMARQPPRPARWLVVDPGDALHARIAARIDAMLGAGWIDEARALAHRYPEDAPAWKGCGYREARAVAVGAAKLDHVRDDILVRTRQYAKRQRTWFRHQLPPGATRVDPRASDADAVVRRWWESEESA